LERETSEMYNLYYTHKVDIRRILLDYSKLENPLLKKFPCEGYNDLFYSIFENQVVIKSSETIEL
jgi:NADH:ubiquinone oxidoreductase subunit C